MSPPASHCRSLAVLPVSLRCVRHVRVIRDRCPRQAPHPTIAADGGTDPTQLEEPASMVTNERIVEGAMDDMDPAFDRSMLVLQYVIAAVAVAAAILLAILR